MGDRRTVRDLHAAQEISAAEIEVAVDSFLAASGTEPHPLGDGFVLDLAATVKAHRWATAVVRDTTQGAATKRTAVRAALLVAHPIRCSRP